MTYNGSDETLLDECGHVIYPDPVPIEDKKKSKSHKPAVYINMTNTVYEVVQRCAEAKGWYRCCDDDEVPWNVYWSDLSVLPERIMKLQSYQRINHFPGMLNICRKNLMGFHLNKMQKLFPDDYNFYPKTFLLPQDWLDFKSHFINGKSNKVMIVKPDAGCQGRGIILTKKLEKISQTEKSVAQIYISKPLLIEGYKFDLRIYVLVTCCDPLRIYIFHDGLVRICTVKYTDPTSKNLGKMKMHLTNYAVNKAEKDFEIKSDIPDIGRGTKRSIIWFLKYLNEQGYDSDKFWRDMCDVIVKTIIMIQPILAHTYHTSIPDENENNNCFEVLGFDILVDRKCKPWLMEVNHSPSFNCDSPLDNQVKTEVIGTTLSMIQVSAYDRKHVSKYHGISAKRRLYGGDTTKNSIDKVKIKEKYEEKRAKLEQKYANIIKLIYPSDDPEKQKKYDQFLSAAEELNGKGSRGAVIIRKKRGSKTGESGGDDDIEEDEDDEEFEEKNIPSYRKPLQRTKMSTRRANSIPVTHSTPRTSIKLSSNRPKTPTTSLTRLNTINVPKTPLSLTPSHLSSHVNPNTNTNTSSFTYSSSSINNNYNNNNNKSNSSVSSTLSSKLENVNNDGNGNTNTESSTIFIKRSPISSPSKKTTTTTTATANITTTSDRDSELYITSHVNDTPKIVINSNMTGINKYSYVNSSSLSEQLKMRLQYKQQQQQQQQQQTVKILKGSNIQNKFGIYTPHPSSNITKNISYMNRSKSSERSRTTPRSRDKNTYSTANQRITPLVAVPIIQGQSISSEKRNNNITYQNQYKINNYNPLLAYRSYNGFSGLR